MSEKLLPCPLCGGCPVLTEAMTEHWVSCGTCGASGGMHGRLKLAVEAWNRRTPAPEGEAWRTVPVEPTEAMIEAAQRATPTTYLFDGEPSNIWSAMLTASPVVPVGVSEVDLSSILETAYVDHQHGAAAPGDRLFVFMAKRIIAALRPTDTGWREITAEARNGDDVLAYDDETGDCHVSHWTGDYWYGPNGFKPTHWMPLPFAPTDTGANHD